MPPWKDVVQKYFLTAFILDTDKGGGGLSFRLQNYFQDSTHFMGKIMSFVKSGMCPGVLKE